MNNTSSSCHENQRKRNVPV